MRAAPSSKWTVKKKFVGSWRIIELQGYDDEYIDLCGPGIVRIFSRGGGRMAFGAVDAELDCKLDHWSKEVVHFTFEGGDEGDPICGRGYCTVDGDQMVGHLFWHLGDDVGFKAKRTSKM